MSVDEMEPNEKDAAQNNTEQMTSRTRTPFPAQERLLSKRIEILEACKWKDLERLRVLAISEGGLISDDIRRLAWPLLLGQEDEYGNAKDMVASNDNWKHLPVHRDEEQVQLDVDRSFIYYPYDQSPKELEHCKSKLFDLIAEVLRRQPYLSYFQGYHDICQVFLLVLDPGNSAPALARLSALRIRDFMLPTFAQALAQLQLIPAIIHTVNSKLWKHLSGTQPFFALSGTLTMYAHDIQEYGEIARLFDVLLAREAAFSVYMFAQIVLQRSDELFETPSDEPEMLHSILSKLPKPLDIEMLIANTVTLFDKHPPESLSGWRSISSNSVLKTARWPDQTTKQSLQDGEQFFNRQVKELRREEQRKKAMKLLWQYRRPISSAALAVMIGVLSIWIRKESGPSGLFGALWRQLSGYRGH